MYLSLSALLLSPSASGFLLVSLVAALFGARLLSPRVLLEARVDQLKAPANALWPLHVRPGRTPAATIHDKRTASLRVLQVVHALVEPVIKSNLISCYSYISRKNRMESIGSGKNTLLQLFVVLFSARLHFGIVQDLIGPLLYLCQHPLCLYSVKISYH